eukprot:Plantae.Rhodophyta-Palmaria_palmata.ctg1809.p1 GENE.Plantae.Rhodophyta-Palmaria_palmata.ctg1809~~Plantae.Rhodophyta-Palmaria_palmata.ctg1809.p1  ORF type:complete len:266 (-),score=43.97 Plantae.Rhodophyta-Palmaria_palmata.ctg1809:97-894(-)
MESGGKSFADSLPSESKQLALVQNFAKLQVASAAHIDHLLALGCHDRRLFKLVDSVRQCIVETSVLGLPDFEPFVEEVTRRCAMIEDASDIKACLVHCDMHKGNICWNKETDVTCIIDYSDCCISHPIFDSTSLGMTGDDLAMYLANFFNFGVAIEKCEDLVLVYRPLSALHDFCSYSRMADSSLEPFRRENANVARECLEDALQMLAGTYLSECSSSSSSSGSSSSTESSSDGSSDSGGSMGSNDSRITGSPRSDSNDVADRLA